MLSAYFCHSRYLHVKYNRALIEVDWLAAELQQDWLAQYLSFSSGVGVQFAQSSANGKQGPILGKMFQTLQTNKNRGNLG
jgi:uroporphyrinogen-III synthase